MVSRSIGRRKTLSKILIFVCFVCLIGGAFFLFLMIINAGNDVAPVEILNDDRTPQEPQTTEDRLPEAVDFQPVVDEWVQSVNGNKSVAIYDLERDEMAASYNLSENYNTASLYKLFVVYEGYRLVQSGEWQADAPAGSTGYSILKCLDLSIRESYSPCAETLWAEIGHDKLDEIIESDFEIHDSSISTLTSNASDITKMMKIFYEHTDVTDDELIKTMKDSFLNQPATTYNWRQGLPSGFQSANVYNKVGWDYNPAGYWNVYHDAAIVEFSDGRHFVVVVMTNRVPFEKIRQFGSQLENAYSN